MPGLTALMLARNEQFCLGLTARAILRWCDSLVILDHASTDATPDIISDVSREHPGRVHRLTAGSEWDEADHRQAMLVEARKHGMSHLAFIDADEVLSGNLIPTIRDAIASLRICEALYLPWVCLWRDIRKWRTSGVWGVARVPMAAMDAPQVRWNAGDGNYQFHRRLFADATRRDMYTHSSGGLLHLQFVQWRRLLAKQALYKMQEVIRWPAFKDVATLNRQYGQAVDETDLATADTLPEWWQPYEPLLRHLHLDDEPWQEAECRRLWDLHGAEKFAGLDLFGVVG